MRSSSPLESLVRHAPGLALFALVAVGLSACPTPAILADTTPLDQCDPYKEVACDDHRSCCPLHAYCCGDPKDDPMHTCPSDMCGPSVDVDTQSVGLAEKKTSTVPMAPFARRTLGASR
jgi:hypothetical protein